jgi:hypothetical protein
MPSHKPTRPRICIIALLGVSICFDLCPRAGIPFAAQQGFDLHRQARFAEAIPVLERARRLEPNDYFVNLLLGIDLVGE